MKCKRMAIVLAIAIMSASLMAVQAGCGEPSSGPTTSAPPITNPTTVPTEAPPEGDSSSSVSVAAAPADYKDAMKAWVDQYDAELTAKVTVLGTIVDPLEATADQIEAAKDFANLMAEAVAALADIQAPAELASYHKAYVDGLTATSAGLQQFVTAMEETNAAGLERALGLMSGAEEIEQAETVLEQALGFRLTSN